MVLRNTISKVRISMDMSFIKYFNMPLYEVARIIIAYKYVRKLTKYSNVGDWSMYKVLWELSKNLN
uniref:Uncharacterized protein n=1 Tax=Macaca fascicularis TaxID=9541 RepID=Q9GMJ5_MACFA|nr:hypothetical protein [Macaca fascicularis]